MPMQTQEFLRARGLAALCADYKISARRHGQFSNLILLKYSQIDSPMTEPIVQQCRGLIVDEADDWRIVSRAYDKFFNHGEPNAANIDWATASVEEKLDGSLMMLYHYRDQWRVSSSGLPDAAGMVEIVLCL
jgi:tRNA splicing ligase